MVALRTGRVDWEMYVPRLTAMRARGASIKEIFSELSLDCSISTLRHVLTRFNIQAGRASAKEKPDYAKDSACPITMKLENDIAEAPLSADGLSGIEVDKNLVLAHLAELGTPVYVYPRHITYKDNLYESWGRFLAVVNLERAQRGKRAIRFKPDSTHEKC